MIIIDMIMKTYIHNWKPYSSFPGLNAVIWPIMCEGSLNVYPFTCDNCN